ncbi:response regulator transcription factor [Saccharibacillus sp. CPCC 101409]|uniref:response regulator transcription factor n=1 Tax=Saccharibacillus sp. CPCC 101409 TaxID=3058041 RepID=UPI00267210D2|nr:response regulator transcription factor [Saccharibacillus sp. CPCC 101409]MDO3413336.1 response regulator transcription factor [Saccharibacillus sp. CPCC 101409]
MFKVLIVDDEPMIREGLRTIVDWASEGFEIVDTASNGKEGLEKFGRLAPDLTIVDIRMPGMSGLDLIEKVRQDNSEAHFLILSGYAEFDYAKRAIVSGVSGYLLKPVDEEELIDELRRVREMLERERTARSARMEQDAALPKAQLVEELLFEDEPLEETQRARLAEALGVAAPAYRIALLDVHAGAEAESRQLAALRQRLKEMFEEKGDAIMFSAGPHIGLLLVRQSYVERGEALRSALLEAAGGLAFHAARGPAVPELAAVALSFREAEGLLHARFFFESGEIIERESYEERFAGTREPAAGEGDSEEGPPLGDKLYYALDIRSRDAADKVLAELDRQVLLRRMDESAARSEYSRALSLAVGKLSSGEASAAELSRKFQSLLLSDVNHSQTYGELKQRVRSRLGELIDRFGGANKDTVLKQMIDFIRRNYSENLKLEVLAEMFGYNSGYLGKLFKNYTGEYFNAFVDKVRVEKAKELLAQGLKVHQVAARVGYSNADYFHAKFRKYVGTSPSAFRSEASGDQQGGEH